ncbi:sensor domain-containing diguanylate cyclase [Dasania marina]|uniref:sensor domain-containing diguanylate cyclase n=1 Tax=Dasania marina TaxID=471499 RepID=UPI0030D77058|tara:strand:- start:39240 stop:40208 length:969 start_codon:yes stop_codon:yes gene_type:complete
MSQADIRNYPDVMQACQTIANLVAKVCQVPAVLIMRQNSDSMEVISSADTPQSPFRSSDTVALNSGIYCETVIATQQPLEVSDALNDPLWHNNPEIKLGMIAYYGVPVNWPDGSIFGTFCALRNVAGHFDAEQTTLINEFASVIEALLKQVSSQEQLQLLADYDSLTQVYSRNRLLERLQHEFDRYQRYQTPLSVIYLDIDHFKQVNDNYGHGIGDLVLQLIAKQLLSNQRQTDFVGRLGGEEFLICLSDSQLNAAMLQAQRLLQKITEIDVEVKNHALDISASCGVAQASHGDQTIDQLIARADQALYKAKLAGRNQAKSA